MNVDYSVINWATQFDVFQNSPIGLTLHGRNVFYGFVNGSLPDGLIINGPLIAPHTNLAVIPEDTVVTKHIDISFTFVKRLPQSWKYINGNFFASDSALEELPQNFTINGRISVKNTKIDHIPNGLTALASGNFVGTRITRVPNDATFVGMLVIDHGVYVRPPHQRDFSINITIHDL